MTMRTIRDQSVRVIQLKNKKWTIQLYANGEWSNVPEGFQQEFEEEKDAVEYFKAKRTFLHS